MYIYLYIYICLSAGLACQNPPIRFHRLVSYCPNRRCYNYLMLLPAKIGTKLAYDHHLPLLWSRPTLPSPAAAPTQQQGRLAPPVFVACKSSDFSRKSLKPEAEIPVPVASESCRAGFPWWFPETFLDGFFGGGEACWRSENWSWMGDLKLILKKFNCYIFFGLIDDWSRI